MKIKAEEFENQDADLIYIAKRLRDATKIEAILTEGGVDYAVEADEYQGGTIFRRTRIGAFFYVLPTVRENAVSLLKANGFRAMDVSGL